MKSIVFSGAHRREVEAKASEWKLAHPTVRVLSDCMPTALDDKTEPAKPSPSEPVWISTIHYEG